MVLRFGGVARLVGPYRLQVADIGGVDLTEVRVLDALAVSFVDAPIDDLIERGPGAERR
jgi:hypothetical protein